MSKDNGPGSSSRAPRFPSHETPRIWFVNPANSPISIDLIRHVLQHGDSVVAALTPADFDNRTQHAAEFRTFLDECKTHEAWQSRLRVVGMNLRVSGECQSAVAEAVTAFGRIDILFCCSSEAIIGTIEEISQTAHTQSLVKTQFATNFFGPVNLIKAVLPQFRHQHNGHLIMLTGVTGHLGTPGLSMYCAAQWAIEGYCDSLAYEVAPFNVCVSIVQSNLEVSVLSNQITSVPPMAAYMHPANEAPLSRRLLAGILDKLQVASDAENATKQIPAVTIDGNEQGLGSLMLSPNQTTSVFPPLPSSFRSNLVAETVHAILAIGGHTNPPSRHIVGVEGIIAVKEKLKTMTEELEDFVEVSSAADY